MLRGKYPEATILDLQVLSARSLPSYDPRSSIYTDFLTNYWSNETKIFRNSVTNHFIYQINEMVGMLRTVKKYVTDAPYCLFPWTHDTTKDCKMSANMHSKNDLFGLIDTFPLMNRLYGSRIHVSADLPIFHLTREDVIGLIDKDLLQMVLPPITDVDDDLNCHCESFLDLDSLKEEYPEIDFNKLDLFKDTLVADRSSMSTLEKYIFEFLKPEDFDFSQTRFDKFQKEHPEYFEVLFKFTKGLYEKHYANDVVSPDKESARFEREFKDRLDSAVHTYFDQVVKYLNKDITCSSDYRIMVNTIEDNNNIPAVKQTKWLTSKIDAFNSEHVDLESYLEAAKDLSVALNNLISNCPEGGETIISIIKKRKLVKEADVEVTAVNEEEPRKVYMLAEPDVTKLEKKEEDK